MADKKVKIKIDLDAEPTLAGLRQLKKELKDIATTDPKFREKQEQINDYADALKSAKIGADNFAEILGTLPGPIGDIGNKVGGTIATLKQFGGIKFESLKNSFADLGKDLVDSGKGIANLTGLTKVYSAVNNTLSKSFFGVAAGETAAATAAGVLTAALAATGITLLIGAISLLVDKYKDWTQSAEKAAEAQKQLNETAEKGAKAGAKAVQDFLKSSEDIEIARAQAAGKSEVQIQAIREKYAKERIVSAKKALADLQQIKGADTTEAADAVAAAEDDLTKIQLAGQTARRKNSEDNTKQLKADRREAELSLMSDEQREIEIIKDNYKKKIDFAKAHGADTKKLIEAQENAIKKIKDKYRKQDLDDMKKGLLEDLQAIIDANKENFEKQKLQLDLQKAQGLIDEETYQQKLYDTKVKYANSDADLINAQIDNLNFLSEKKKDNAEKDKEWADKQKEYNKVIQESWIDLGRTTADTFAKLGGLFEEGSAAAKAFGIASVLIGAATSIAQINFRFAEGISDARKAITKGNAIAIEGIGMLGNPITAGVGAAMIASGGSAVSAGTALLGKLQLNKGLQIAGVVATSAAQIAAITSAKGKSGGGASSGGGGGDMGGGTAAPAYAGAATSMAAPQIQTGGGMNPSTQIAQTITGAQRPIRAYVVSGEISSQQALDRRTSRAATFGV